MKICITLLLLFCFLFVHETKKLQKKFLRRNFKNLLVKSKYSEFCEQTKTFSSYVGQYITHLDKFEFFLIFINQLDRSF